MQPPLDRPAVEIALDLAAKGYVPVAMRPGLKVPAERGWQRWMTLPVTEASIVARWRGTRHGVALLCKGILVIDVDDGALLAGVLEKCGLTPGEAPTCRTPGGGYHVHVRHRTSVALRTRIRLHGQAVDLLTGARLSILPPHTDERGTPYEWLTPGLPPVAELPLARVGWTRERGRACRHPTTAERSFPPAPRGAIRHPEAYCLRVESVMGNHGSKGLVRVCCVLRDAGRTPEEAFAFLKRVWNPACARPAWSDAELWYAINRHYGLS